MSTPDQVASSLPHEFAMTTPDGCEFGVLDNRPDENTFSLYVIEGDDGTEASAVISRAKLEEFHLRLTAFLLTD